MAWEWSHSPDACRDAHNNLSRLPIGTLREIYAEWEAWDRARRKNPGDTDGFDERAYNRALRESKRLAGDVLVDYIWERASEEATCDNGGFYLWMCPYGCSPHSVSCDDEGSGDEEDAGEEEA